MQYVESWRAVAAATGAADRAAAEDGVRLAYRSAGLAEPEEFVWADSPKAAVEAVEKLVGAGRSVRDEVRTRPWAQERRRMYDELGPAGWSALWSATGAQLWETTAALAERIRAGVVAALAQRPEDESAVRLVLLDAVLGQHDAAWLAAFDGRGDRLDGLAEVARHAGFGGGPTSARWCSANARRHSTATRRGGSTAGTAPPSRTLTGSRCTPGAACRSPPSSWRSCRP